MSLNHVTGITIRNKLKPSFRRLYQPGGIKNLRTQNQPITQIQRNGLYYFSRPMKQCIECAKVHYHHNSYDYRWLKKCPIHQCDLVESCPSCGQPWPAYNLFLNPDDASCYTCGPHMHDKYLMSITDLSLNEKIELEIGALENKLRQKRQLVSKYQIDAPSVIFRDTQTVHFVESELFSDLVLNSTSYNNKPYLLSSKDKIKTETFRMFRVSAQKPALSNRKFLYESLYKTRYKVLKKIATGLSTCHPHQLKLFNFYTWKRNEGLLHPHCFCNYCIALSLWFDSITLQHIERNIFTRLADTLKVSKADEPRLLVEFEMTQQAITKLYELEITRLFFVIYNSLKKKEVVDISKEINHCENIAIEYLLGRNFSYVDMYPNLPPTESLYLRVFTVRGLVEFRYLDLISLMKSFETETSESCNSFWQKRSNSIPYNINNKVEVTSNLSLSSMQLAELESGSTIEIRRQKLLANKSIYQLVEYINYYK